MNQQEQYKLENEQFFSKISSQTDVLTLRGGVVYKPLKHGDGLNTPQPRSRVTCHYKGSLTNGKVFDSSYDRKTPATFRVNSLISGFQIALVNMHVGDHWLVYIPADKGYGSQSVGKIPAHSTLIFEIELLSIE